MITSVAASKLTGALPALDGSALTGIVAITKSASDPAINTNPSLGALWTNTTSGEMFSCTDATAGANVWTNIGTGEGNIVPYNFVDGGSMAGYAAGGWAQPGRTAESRIEKVNFATDAVGTAIPATLTAGQNSPGGSSSATHGYAACGQGSVNASNIDRFAFASENSISDMGNLTSGTSKAGGSSNTYGYKTYWNGSSSKAMEKYSFSSHVSSFVGLPTINATSGDGASLCSSTTHIYVMGGDISNVMSNTIEKFSTSADGNSVDHADLNVIKYSQDSGSQTPTHGYMHGGYNNAGSAEQISVNQFAFANGNTAVTHANLSVARGWAAANASTTHGYTLGGTYNPSTDQVDKFSYASAGTAVDIGNLSINCRSQAHIQN